MKLKSRKKKGGLEQILPLASEGKLLSNKDSRNKSYVWCEVTESKLWTSLYCTVG